MNKSDKKVVKIGIMSLAKYKERTIAIAKGKYKRKKNEPKTWFTSMKSLANTLSEDNQYLLKLIADLHPQSIKELETATGRKANNLLRTLRTMENYGLVKLVEGQPGKGRTPLIPQVVYDMADIQISLSGNLVS